jgi:hypothetical protein
MTENLTVEERGFYEITISFFLLRIVESFDVY